jgi:hypothetical protein
MENKWLGFNKVLLFGKPVEEERTASINKKISALTRKHFSSDATFVESGRRKLLNRILDQVRMF